VFTQQPSTVVRPFCKIGRMGDALWNLDILMTMAQVPPLDTPMVVVGAISRFLALIAAFTMETH